MFWVLVAALLYNWLCRVVQVWRWLSCCLSVICWRRPPTVHGLCLAALFMEVGRYTSLAGSNTYHHFFSFKIDRSWWNLTQWCRFVLSNVPAFKNLNFENPRCRLPFWKTVKLQYLCNRLTDFDKIWHDDVHWHYLCRRTFKIALLKIQDGGRPLSWKTGKLSYLSKGLSGLHEI